MTIAADIGIIRIKRPIGRIVGEPMRISCPEARRTRPSRTASLIKWGRDGTRPCRRL
jgi:hypothetical protein